MRKGLFDKIERSLIGKIRLQPFYESLHRVSVRGMNYMQSQAIGRTGEIGAMKYALARHEKQHSNVLFDVGANEGQFALEMSKIFTDQFVIHSFEPAEKTFKVLSSKTAGKNIIVHNHGLSFESAEIMLHNSNTLIGTIYPMDNSSAGSELISLKRLEDFCSENEIEEIFYLKIDVEGAELDVLRGAENLIINKKIQFVQFEYGPNCMVSRIFLKDFFDFLKDYTIYRIVKNGLRELTYNEIIEIPLTSNFLAELK